MHEDEFQGIVKYNPLSQLSQQTPLRNCHKRKFAFNALMLRYMHNGAINRRYGLRWNARVFGNWQMN